MRKIFSSLALLIGLPLSTVLIWMGYSEVVLTLVWSRKYDSVKIFYLLLGAIGITLFYILVTYGLRELPRLTGWILLILGVVVILFVGNFQTLPFVRSLSEKEFSNDFMSTVATWRGNITHETPRIYPGLVQEWQTIELIDTIFGTALAVVLLLTAVRGIFARKEPDLEPVVTREPTENPSR